MNHSLYHRPTRLRQTASVRDLIAEYDVSLNHLIMPLFIHETLEHPKAIPSMPGIYQLPLHALEKEINELANLGVKAVILFGIPNEKDPHGSASLNDNGIIPKAIRLIKSIQPDMLVIADVCFCEYTDHGHCGMLNGFMIDNDATLIGLQKQSVVLAKAGADWIAPSGMMDGMVKSIREGLNAAGFQHVAILSYAIKYASALYGPFRDAAEGAPQFGDRKTYQADYRNRTEAIREARYDVLEGADLLMVKPASLYLDIIRDVKEAFPDVPLCAYQVSGEYSMIKFASKQGVIDELSVMMESLIAIKRAGASLIITYFAKEFAENLLQR